MAMTWSATGFLFVFILSQCFILKVSPNYRTIVTSPRDSLPLQQDFTKNVEHDVDAAENIRRPITAHTKYPETHPAAI